MTYKKQSLLLLIICFMFIGFEASNSSKTVNAFSPQVIQQGAVGDDVIELQSRLQYIGFFHGDIDGAFGWGTYWALRNFQEEFGMKVDGLAGEQTKERLENASNYDEGFVKEQIRQGNKFTHYGSMDLQDQTAPGGEESQEQPEPEIPEGGEAEGTQPEAEGEGGQEGTAEGESEGEPEEGQPEDEQAGDTDTASVNVPQGFSQNDIQLMANAVYGEARGEPYEGQVAVAAVILNRIESDTFPNTVSGVIFEPRAFTAVADGQIWLEPNERAREAVLDAVNGWDPSGNAEYYYNPVTATSDWIFSRQTIKQIGKHIFAE
ncbi:N-acetylmuramoyl-L-alanine amidase [Virgibacillus natechei]|uniref:Spore cortex-lytic enzyme n=1 Tax=Virgibacillus natechei TaxID=1216297 RepID=A0ABS4IFF0_9BACI|nr:spore cortex-lytic enzyme [Virgibacillus natechei]MBP1969630.1 N-acetylmuramoyl-L-alanine amidase [Virgibacillus natechei]UZD11358.1 spore cortex-lytic enzyme [Virgibacillus natechei]